MFFSICIPAYKSLYLKKAIDSCLAQSFADFEIIVLDDDSPMNISEIVGSYRDNRIKYYRNDLNVGAKDVVDNWNKCLSLSSGDYLLCMGDDDVLPEDALETYCSLISRFPSLAVYHALTNVIDANGKMIDMAPVYPAFESVYSFLWRQWSFGIFHFIGDFVFDSRKLREAGGFYKLPLAWGSDCISTARAAAISGIAHTDKPAFMYRRNPHSISSTGDIKLKVESALEEKAWFEEFLKAIPENTMDVNYHRLLSYSIEPHYSRKIGNIIAEDLSKRFYRVFFWSYHASDYGLDCKEIVRSILMALKIIFL